MVESTTFCKSFQLDNFLEAYQSFYTELADLNFEEYQQKILKCLLNILILYQISTLFKYFLPTQMRIWYMYVC